MAAHTPETMPDPVDAWEWLNELRQEQAEDQQRLEGASP